MSITTYLLILGLVSSIGAEPDVLTSNQDLDPYKILLKGIAINDTREHCDVCVEKVKYCSPAWLPALNLNRAMKGIDIAKKIPMPFKPEDDPSVKKIVFNSVYRNEILGNMEQYTYIDLTEKLDCTATFKTTAWSSAEEYIYGSAASSMSSWSVGYEGPTVSGSFGIPGLGDISVSMPPNTASYGDGNEESADDMDQFFSSEKGSISHSEARCSIYSVEIDIDEPSLSLHPSFIEAIRNIDKATTENEKKDEMKKFIDKFGSHYASKSIMGIGILFETRYTEEETINHDVHTRNECSSQSGGFKIFGWSNEHSETKCEGSLADTTQGDDTSVKRFSMSSYGTLPVAGSLAEWAKMVNEMMEKETLSPHPIQQELRLILDLFATPAVANIVHNDGTKVNVTNLFLTALDGYGIYCSHNIPACNIPACANTVLMKGIETNGIVFTQKQGFDLNGRPTYVDSEGLTLYLSNNEGWIVSQHFSEIPDLKSSPCPQKKVEFQEIKYAIGSGPLPGDIENWKICSQKCFDLANCKFWQHNIDTKKCSLIEDYNSARTTSADIATGTRDCPGDKALFANGMCVENMSSRSMWMSQGINMFEKDIEVEAFDPTFLIIAGGFKDNNYLNDVEIIGKKYCEVPDLPVGNCEGNLVVTAGDHRVLYCGGAVSDGASDLCHVLDVSSGAWHQEEGRLSTVRADSTAITMPDGVYILGGEGGNGGTSNYLPTSEKTWQLGPNIPYDFSSGCGVKITDEEFVLIGGRNSQKRISSYNVKTSTWTRRSDLIEKRFWHACSFHPPTNSIIVAGGIGSDSTTEIIPIDTWRPTKAGDLKQVRFGHAMVTVGGKHPTVYAIGGIDDLTSVEVWDQLKAEWKMSPVSLNIGRKLLAALAVPPSAIC